MKRSAPVRSADESAPLLRPKSDRYTWSGRPTRVSRSMLVGLTSRCTSPAACAVSRADAPPGDNRCGALGGQWSHLFQERVHVAAWHVAHRDEQHPIRLTSLEHRDDVRIVHRGRGPRFEDEAVPERLVRRQGRREDLQSYLPLEPLVLGPEYNRHSAPADLLPEAVSRDPRTGKEAGHEPDNAGVPVTHRASSTGHPVAPAPSKRPPGPPTAVDRPPWLNVQSDFCRRIRRRHGDKPGQPRTIPPCRYRHTLPRSEPDFPVNYADFSGSTSILLSNHPRRKRARGLTPARFPCGSPCPRTSTRSGWWPGSGGAPARARPPRGRVPGHRSPRAPCGPCRRTPRRRRCRSTSGSGGWASHAAAAPCRPPSRSSSTGAPRRRPRRRTRRVRRPAGS